MRMFEDYRGIPREAMFLIYAGILPALAYGMFYTDIAYFLTVVQGLKDVFMGSVIMVMGITTVVAGIPLGIAADRYGRRKILIIGNIVASAMIAVFALTSDPTILILGAVLEGISEAAYMAASSAIMADKAGDEKRTAVFSLSGFMSGIAFGVGSFAIPLVVVIEGYGFSNREAHIILYLLLAALSFASTLLLLRVSESKALHKEGGIRGVLPKKSMNILIKYIIAGSIVAFGAGMFVPLMTRWLNLAYGVSDSVSGPILGVSNVLIGVATLAAPPLARRLGIVKSIVVTQAFSTIFMFTTPLSPEYLTASTVYTIRTFLMNMAGPLQSSMLMGLVSADERGAASGISGALWRLPNSLSTTVGAWLMGIGLLSMPFYIATVLYIISITSFWLFFHTTKMPEETYLNKLE
jgi:MFS family permease